MLTDEISVYFSGHNIRPFAVLAIKSFLLHYPELKDSIYYFDDDSTDGTVDELKELGIKITTWTPALKRQFDTQLRESLFPEGIKSMIIRCDYLFKDILSQCNTRYLLVQDGDTVTLNRGFLEDYINSGKAISASTSESVSTISQQVLVSKNPLYQIYKQYANIENGKVVFSRVHPYHVFFDTISFDFKDCKVNLTSNLSNTDYLAFNNGILMDVGSDLLDYVTNHSVDFNRTDLCNTVYHWSWISSIMRDSLSDCSNSSTDKHTQIIRDISKNKPLKSAIKECDMTPAMLLKHLRDNIRKSTYNEDVTNA